MRILHTVEFYHPSIGGMQEVVKQLSERLVKLGHDVTVATSKIPGRDGETLNGVKIEEFAVSGNAVRGDIGEVSRYREFLLNSNFDVITNFAAQQWATDIMLPILDEIRGAKVFVPTGFSGLYMAEYKDYFERIKAYMRKYDMNVFLSDDYRDVVFARANGVSKCTLIPNGAGEDEFSSRDLPDIRKKLNIPSSHLLILHVGSHTGGKGHREAIEIFERANIKNATFLIAGNYPPAWEPVPVGFLRKFKRKGYKYVFDLAFKLFGVGRCPQYCSAMPDHFNSRGARNIDGKRILVEALSRKDVLAAYHAADIFLFPSNIECSPLVLFECMASKTPFLTTDVGNAAEIIKWSGAGLLLPTNKRKNGNSKAEIKGSVEILECLCRDSATRQDMAACGFKAWKERFTWEKITKDYERLYESLVK